MLKILIVDDEKLVRDNLLRLVDWNSHGFDIVGQADSCKAAITLLGELSPDIVICDIEMPRADGVTVVRLAYEYGYDCKFVMLSAYDDFNYVRDALTAGAVDYLLKHQLTQDRLLQVLYKIAYSKNNSATQKFSHNMQQTFICDIVGGNIALTHDTLQILNNNGVLCEEINGIILAKCLDSDNNASEVTQNILAAVHSKLSAEYNNAFFINRDVLLLDVHPAKVKPVLQTLTDLIQESGNILYAVHGTLNADSLLLVDLIKKMQLRLECSFYHNTTTVWGMSVDDDTFLTVAVSKHMDNYIELFALQNIEIMLANLLFCKGGYYEPYAIKKLTIDICNQLFRNLQLREYKADNILHTKFSWIKQIDDATSNLTLAFLLSNLFSQIQNFIDCHSQPQLSPLVAEVTNFLADNLGYGITLQSVSEKFYVNKSYLSNVFHSQIGKTFTRYLMELRMEKAKELLCDPSYSVSDVANKTGFIETSYFSTTFKKEVGVTPLLYKQRNGK